MLIPPRTQTTIVIRNNAGEVEEAPQIPLPSLQESDEGNEDEDNKDNENDSLYRM